MRKLYTPHIAMLFPLSLNLVTLNGTDEKGLVTLRFDNSKNGNRPLGTVYVILDKYDLTAAGVVKEKFEVNDNTIILDNLPVGKYYADIYLKGSYRQHFSTIIQVTKKGRCYTFKVEEIGFYDPSKLVIPESNDFSRSGITNMHCKYQGRISKNRFRGFVQYKLLNERSSSTF